MTWVPCNCCDNFWCTSHKKHAHECECPPAEEWTTNPYAVPRKKKDAMLYFILDQADDGGADHFYVAGELDEDGVIVHYWTQDLLLACVFIHAEDAACTVDALDDLHLAVAALPESLVAFVVERHNYTETLDRVEKQAANFIEQVNAFARAIQGPGGAHQGPGGEQ